MIDRCRRCESCGAPLPISIGPPTCLYCHSAHIAAVTAGAFMHTMLQTGISTTAEELTHLRESFDAAHDGNPKRTIEPRPQMR